jgi:hypothetical protein
VPVDRVPGAPQPLGGLLAELGVVFDQQDARQHGAPRFQLRTPALRIPCDPIGHNPPRPRR